MKKVLLGSTALVAAGMITGAAAAQEVSFSGSVEFALGFVDQDAVTDRDYDVRNKGEFVIDVRDVADNGIEYGARMDLDDVATDTKVDVDETWVFLRGGFGQVTLGDDDNAGDDLNVGVPTAGTGGFDGNWSDFATGALGITTTNAENDGDATKIKYSSPDFQGVQAGISFAPDSESPGETPDLTNDGDFSDVISIGGRYEGDFGNVGLLVGGAFQTGDGAPGLEDLSAWDIGAVVTFGPAAFGAQYIDDGDSGAPIGSNVEFSAFSVGATYSTGPWTFGADWFSGEIDTPVGDITEDVLGLTASYTVAAGLGVDADFVFFDDEAGGVSSDGTVFVVRTKVSF